MADRTADPGLKPDDEYLDALIAADTVRQVEGLLRRVLKAGLGRHVAVDLRRMHLTHAKKMAAEAKHWVDLNPDNTTLRSIKTVDFASSPKFKDGADTTYAEAFGTEIVINLGFFSTRNFSESIDALEDDRTNGHTTSSPERGAGQVMAHELWHHSYFDAVAKNKSRRRELGASADHYRNDASTLGKVVDDKTARKHISGYAGKNKVEAHAEAGAKVTQVGHAADWASKKILHKTPGPQFGAVADAAPGFRGAMAKLHRSIDERTGLPWENLGIVTALRGVAVAFSHTPQRHTATRAPALPSPGRPPDFEPPSAALERDQNFGRF